jgi:hypothetical protein
MYETLEIRGLGSIGGTERILELGAVCGVRPRRGGGLEAIGHGRVPL